MKVCSTDSLKSTATETTQAVKFVRFSEKIRIRKILSRKDYTLEEIKATWSSQEERQQISRQRREDIKEIDDGEDFKDFMLALVLLLVFIVVGICLLDCRCFLSTTTPLQNTTLIELKNETLTISRVGWRNITSKGQEIETVGVGCEEWWPS